MANSLDELPHSHRSNPRHRLDFPTCGTIHENRADFPAAHPGARYPGPTHVAMQDPDSRKAQPPTTMQRAI